MAAQDTDGLMMAIPPYRQHYVVYILDYEGKKSQPRRIPDGNVLTAVEHLPKEAHAFSLYHRVECEAQSADGRQYKLMSPVCGQTGWFYPGGKVQSFDEASYHEDPVEVIHMRDRKQALDDHSETECTEFILTRLGQLWPYQAKRDECMVNVGENENDDD